MRVGQFHLIVFHCFPGMTHEQGVMLHGSSWNSSRPRKKLLVFAVPSLSLVQDLKNRLCCSEVQNEERNLALMREARGEDARIAGYGPTWAK